MQYYKLYGESESKLFNNTDENLFNAKLNFANELSAKMIDFNYSLKKNQYIFVASVRGNNVNVGILVNKPCDVAKLVDRFLREMSIKLIKTHLEEVTLNTFSNMLSEADNGNFIENDYTVLEDFDLDNLTGRLFDSLNFSEGILEKADRKKLYGECSKLFSKSSFEPELDRIYAGRLKKVPEGHPVHYMIETDDKATSENMQDILLRALYDNKRLLSTRFSSIHLRPNSIFSKNSYNSLYKSSIGGTIIVHFKPIDDTEDEYASASREIIEDICAVMKKYRNRVLTVFCLPRECTKLKEIFYDYLDDMTIVELKEEFVYGEHAADYLRLIAKENNIRTDKNLFAKIENEKGYLAHDLQFLFDEWYNKKLKTVIYPQYNGIASIKHEILKAAPKGSAYDELSEMIGLGDAKKVITQALNYFKAQKIFAEKGLAADHPSMHMIFTGNPGTAKTTVARLFARIMKENGILSTGDLIEVGRGDLVGKFVGWTAPTIQKKFKQAPPRVDKDVF